MLGLGSANGARLRCNLSLLDMEGDSVKDGDSRSNSPLSYGGYRISPLMVDSNDPDNVAFSIIQPRGMSFIYLGFFLMLLSLLYVLFERPKPKT